MTNDEIIKGLNAVKEECGKHLDEGFAWICQPINAAIEILKAEPCKDAISRQAVDELSRALVHTTRDKADFLCNFWEGLQKLPPVTPQQKIGQYENSDVLDKIRSEIEFEVDHRTNMICAEDVFEIIDRYIAETKETEEEKDR